MEKKPFKIKYGTAGFVYVWSYFLTHAYYPHIWEAMLKIEGHDFKTALSVFLVFFIPIGILFMCNDN